MESGLTLLRSPTERAASGPTTRSTGRPPASIPTSSKSRAQRPSLLPPCPKRPKSAGGSSASSGFGEESRSPTGAYGSGGRLPATRAILVCCGSSTRVDPIPTRVHTIPNVPATEIVHGAGLAGGTAGTWSESLGCGDQPEHPGGNRPLDGARRDLSPGVRHDLARRLRLACLPGHRNSYRSALARMEPPGSSVVSA